MVYKLNNNVASRNSVQLIHAVQASIEGLFSEIATIAHYCMFTLCTYRTGCEHE